MGEKGEKGSKGETPDFRYHLLSSPVLFSDYARITHSSSTSVSLSSTPTFLKGGDEVLIIQMQGSSAGYYDVCNVSSISGTTVYLVQSISRSYTSSSSASAQLVRIEQFGSVDVKWNGTVSARAWDGVTDGIVAIRAGTLVVEQGGRIDVSRQGFRGGPKKAIGKWVGVAGESWPRIGFPHYGNQNRNGGGGGSGYCSCGEAAGGGSYGTVGNTPTGKKTCGGGDDGQNGVVYGDSQLTKLFLGSGGGGGCRDDDQCEYTDGASGGGLIYVVASRAIISDGSFLSIGGSPTGGPSSTCDDTIGGPGSGGTIYLRVNDLTVRNPNSVFDVDGGGRVYISNSKIYSGTGGQGRVRVDYNTINGYRRGSSGARNEEQKFSNVGYWGSF